MMPYTFKSPESIRHEISDAVEEATARFVEILKPVAVEVEKFARTVGREIIGSLEYHAKILGTAVCLPLTLPGQKFE